MGRNERQERIGIEARLYWGDRLLESASIDHGELRLITREGTRPRYDKGARGGMALARIEEGRAIVTAPPGLEVEVRRGEDERWRGAEASLGPGAVARIADGPLVHQLRLVTPPAAARGGFLPGLDLGLARRLAISALVAAAVVGASFVIPVDDSNLGDRKLSGRILRIIAAIPPRPRPPPIRIERLDAESFRLREAMRATSDRETVARGPVRRPNLLVLLETMGGGGGVFSSGGGSSLLQAVNDLRVADGGVGNSHGIENLGPRGGLGIPGPGLSLDLLTGRGRQDGVGFQLAGRTREAVRVSPGKVSVIGGLSKELIGKTIKSMQRQIVACYERELQKEPNLEGKLAVSFVIGGSGAVSEVIVVEDSLERDAVAACVKAKILGWRFPPPEGGGEVIVNYPWIFRSAGAE